MKTKIHIYETHGEAKAAMQEIIRRARELADEFQIYMGTIQVHVAVKDQYEPDLIVILGRTESIADGLATPIDRQKFAEMIREQNESES